MKNFDHVIIHVDLKDFDGAVKSTKTMMRMLAKEKSYSKSWLVFAGYDDDPRELWEIPECIRFAKTLIEAFQGDPDDLTVLGDDRRQEGPGIGLSKLFAIAGEAQIELQGNGIYAITLTPLASGFIAEFQGTGGTVN